MIAGVCSGAAEYLGMDANILRLALVVLTVLGVGSGVALYAIAWLLVPEEGEENSIVQNVIDKQQQKRRAG
jgi:phage shock protein PspC (stress-responsive transcriptional regulator)